MTRDVSNRRGQARIIEAFLSVLIIVVCLVTVLNLTRPIRSIYLRETADLRRLAYNILNDMGDARVFENIVVKGNLTGKPWEEEMRAFLSTNLPPGVLFQMDIYELRMNASGVWRIKLNRKPISNVESFENVIESESVVYTYVCVGEPDRTRGVVLLIILKLGYGG